MHKILISISIVSWVIFGKRNNASNQVNLLYVIEIWHLLNYLQEQEAFCIVYILSLNVETLMKNFYAIMTNHAFNYALYDALYEVFSVDFI